MACIFALAVTCVTFGWIIATIHRYTGERIALTFFLTLAYALFFQGKILLFFLARRYLFQVRLAGFIPVLAMCAILAVADRLSPELFPWSWGNTLAAEPHLRQLASVGSVYLVSFSAALGGYVVAQAGRKCVPVIVLFILLWLGGVLLRYVPTVITDALHLKVLVVQTNIGAAPEARRGDAAFAGEAIGRLFNQTIEGVMLHPQSELIIWPEASMPFHSADAAAENASIYSVTFDGVLEYITRTSGSPVIYQDMGYRERMLYSRLNVRPPADELAVFQYRKRRLVPWGEYLPGEEVFPRLRNLFPEAGRFKAGLEGTEIKVGLPAARTSVYSRAQLEQDVQILSAPQKIAAKYPAPFRPGRIIRVKPLLCYEALYPADAHTRNADLLVNLSSDAWFGDGIEGQQHASAALMRSVENGIPMIRAAMSGTSSAVDHQGNELVRRTVQGRPEILYAEIPLQKQATLFSRFGMRIFWLIMLGALLPALVAMAKAYTRENR